MDIKKTGFWPWFLQRVSAVFLVAGMAVHIIILPLSGRTIDSSAVNMRLQFTGWIVFDLFLLAACVFHGFNGVFSVLMDFNPGKAGRTFIKYFLIILGLAFVILGIMIPITFMK